MTDDKERTSFAGPRRRLVQGIASGLTFCVVFVLQWQLRRWLNWPPNSWPELAVSTPMDFFWPGVLLKQFDHQGAAFYLFQGSLGWFALGFLVGVIGSTLRVVNRLPLWPRFVVHAASAILFLVVSRFMFPVSGLGTV
jgi:hypothetical protein